MAACLALHVVHHGFFDALACQGAVYATQVQRVPAGEPPGVVVSLSPHHHAVKHGELLLHGRVGLETAVDGDGEVREVALELRGHGVAQRRDLAVLLGRQTLEPGIARMHDEHAAARLGHGADEVAHETIVLALVDAYAVGAAGLPFAVLRGYIGNDLPKVNPAIKFITCPYTGERLATVPAIRPDVTVIHALRADREGNVLLEGILGVQKEAVLAAKRAIVTVEEIVEDFGPRSPNAVILPSWTVNAIAVVPGGAYPSYAQGYYRRFNAFYKQWDEIARDRDSFLAWMKDNVLGKKPEDFAQSVRNLRVAAR